MQSRFQFQLLGTPQLAEGGRERALPGRRALALLAVLALDGRVARARLATLFWGEQDEAGARRNLRRELARLRDAGLEASFAAFGDTLELGAAVGCDARDFEAACAREDHEAALALWRGPLLDGFALGDAPGFEAWLAERREAALRRWRDAAAATALRLERAGELRAALALRLRLSDADPLQEAHHADAMRLHEALGERSAALELYERCQRLLRDELGLEPLASTTAIAERLRTSLRIEPLLARPAGAGRPGLDAPLVGREAPAQRLRAAAAPFVLLVGEAGVGKTRLAQECLQARSTLSLRCEAAARGAALLPVDTAIRSALDHGAGRERLAGLGAAARREAARLVPALDPQLRSEARAAGDAGAQERFFDALGDVLDALAGATPQATLFVDDLHAADSATLALLRQLAHRRARDAAPHARIVATARTQELEEQAAARDLVRRLEREGLLERIALEPLSAAQTLELVRELSEGAGGELFAARLQRVTGGNPFFLLETVRFLFEVGELRIDEGGRWATRYDDATTDYAELPVPPTVAATVIERVERLGAASRRVLEAAALADAGFTLDLVQPATALSDWESLDGLERAVQAQLLVELEAGYRYAHDLARDAVAASLRPERRRLIHERLARTLIARQARADAVAVQLEGAQRPDEARGWRIAAAREAQGLLARREALAQTERALALGPDATQAIAIRRLRLELRRVLHDLAGVAAELDALDALAAVQGDGLFTLELLAERTEAALRHHHYAEAITHAERAWAHPAHAGAPAALRQRLLRDGALALVEQGRYAEGRAIYDRELARADQHPPAYLAALHFGMANYHTSFSENAAALPHLERAVALYAEAGEDERRLRSLNLLAYCQYFTGAPEAAIVSMQAVLDEAEALKNIALLRNTLLNFILYVLEVGDVERAARQLARAQQLLEGVNDPATQCRLQIRVCEVAAHRGELGAAVAAARQAVALLEANGGGLPDFWPWFILSRLLWRIGDRAAAAAVYRGLPASPAWLPTAAPAVRFFALGWTLPDAPAEALAQLEATEAAPGVLVDPMLIDLFRARALYTLGRHAEALALMEPQDPARAALTFTVGPDDRLALRLQARAALGEDTAAVVAAAEALLPVIAPLAALELHAGLAAAYAARADAAGAARHRAAQRALARRLAASLAGEAALQRCFAAVHLPGG